MAWPIRNLISKTTLPDNSVTPVTYYLKDADARDAIDALSEAIAGGVSFNIAWDGSSTPDVSKIPYGVVVEYGTPAVEYTGTLATTAATPGAFYLVYSATQPSGEADDAYDEYVVIKPDTSDSSTWFWEKIGDTKINFNVTTDTVIGSDATIKVSTQPVFSLKSNDSSGTGHTFGVATGITSASASGDNVTVVTGYSSPITDKVYGEATTFTPKENDATATGRIAYTKSVSTTSIGAVHGNTDIVAAITSLGTPSTESAVKSVSPTTRLLTTNTIYGVQSSTTSVRGVKTGDNSTTTASHVASGGNGTAPTLGTAIKVRGVKTGTSSTTTASKATVGTATSQTTATGAATPSTSNNDWLKGLSVSNETLIFSSVTPTTQTTSIPNISFADVTVPIRADADTSIPNVTSVGSASTWAFEDVTVPIRADADTTVPIKNANATRFATGATDTTDTHGASVVTAVSVGDTFSAVTGYTPTTDNVIGEDNPITIQSGTGKDVTVATGGTTKYLSIDVGTNDKVTAITGLGTASTDTVLGTGSTITVTPTIKYPSVNRDTNVAIAWDDKDTTTVVTGIS